MSVVIVKRQPRVMPPTVPEGEVKLESPPELPRDGDNDIWMNLLPVMGMGGSVAFFFMPGAAPYMKVVGALMAVSTVAMAVAQVVRARRGGRAQMGQERRDYFRYLDQVRKDVRKTSEAQRNAQLYQHPSPDQLWAIAGDGKRLWERRPSDNDFSSVRIGTGWQQLSTPLVAPETAPKDELEPLTAEAMKSFLDIHRSLPDLPIAVSLRAFYHVVVTGSTDEVYGNVRAALGQLSALHSPEEMIIAVVAHPGSMAEWDWTKWLPHAQHPSQSDGAGQARLFFDDLGQLEESLASQLDGRPRWNRDGTPVADQPHIIVVLDGGSIPPDSQLAGAEGLQGVTFLEVAPGALDDQMSGGLTVHVREKALDLYVGRESAYSGKPDLLSYEQAEALARQLSPLRMGSGEEGEPLLSNLDFTDLMGIGDAGSVDMARTWRPRSLHERLRVPIGIGGEGEPVMLDIKEASQEGMGPHGLCVGATGSGKSELLRTLVLGLAVTHSSETLNFILADFKGGATFTGMADMPHTAAVITNLADELTLVDRMRDAITGELNRRQETLRRAGNYANITDYEKARAAGAALDPLPSLVLIIDEFSELLTAKPDFIDMFIQIGRIGRSLGVHMLLASQRLEEGKLRGLDTFLSYRIGLRTFSAAESRTAIGVPDAYHLPNVPGAGFLKYDTETMVQFKAAYVSGAYRAAGPTRVSRATQTRPVMFTATPVALPVAPEPEAPDTDTVDDALADTVLDVIVQKMVGQGPSAHQVWLPPLDEPPSLDQLLPALAATPERGLTAPEYTALGRLAVPVALLDKPFEQRRDVLYRDFSGAAGHGFVIGGPQSGKSTLLRTLMTSFGLTHTPSEVQFYCLDFGGGSLLSMEDLHHVGGVANRLDGEKVRRTVSEVMTILNEREEYFRAHNVDSIATFRQRRAAGQLPDQKWGDVFLVIDGWATFKNDYEMLEADVTDIAQRGLGFGIHLILTASRYTEVRPALKDLLQNRIELRLGDPSESEIDRKVAANVPAAMPGRGLSPDKLHLMTALPRIDGSSTLEDLPDATRQTISAVNEHWTGEPAPAVRLLPTMLEASRLPKGSDYPEHGLAFGIDESSLRPVFVNFETDPLFVVFGESESGKSALLRLLMHQITERYTPDKAKIVVGDYRRAHLQGVPEAHVSRYCAAAPSLQETLEGLAGSMSRRMPGPDVTPEQLRNRSWYDSPDAFVVIDDYDLVATGQNPLMPLLEYLPFARDVGLRVILARSSGGASRALYEPVMQRMKELGAQGVVLSGDKSEGALLGNISPTQLPVGRGYFQTRRRGGQLVQTGWMPANN
ncbi:secretion protein EccC [Streptomyces abyssalis]|uniref:Secretion protein EccC n=1 Tax=Streptomyces abyssalis TaxID=933944 RepID=A0A1E7JHJ0_9ACTN|nr:type VII secretion protein EccCa [Streptomyces abyssalis]OEU85954.1 secretion protein EccC [Streptomyces abyssalis]OEU92577.1 secretion protein EccC [Streptomyces abyssalis]OEV30323.1 secretion protein EccC [Streptomyces nanshensis]